MSRYFALTKTLFINSTDLLSISGKLKAKNIKQILLYVIIALSMLPTSIGIGVLTSILYDALSGMDQSGLILGMAFSTISMFVFFLGIFFVINVFYFSKDIENLLYLPLKPSEILGAKFTITLIYEYMTEAAILLPVIISYGIKSRGGILYWLYSFIVFLTLPVIPLIYASVLNIIIMRFTSFAKNKDMSKIIGGILGMGLALGANIFIQRMAKAALTPEALKSLLNEGNNSLLSTVSLLFPANKFAVLAMINTSNLSGVVNLLMYITVIVVLLVIFILLGEKLYFSGVIGISEATAKRHEIDKSQFDRLFNKSNPVTSYAMKELKLLVRTPVYFFNCVLVSFILPVFIPIITYSDPSVLKELAALSSQIGNDTAAGIILGIAFAISLFSSASNCITSTAISREGQNIFFNKCIPMSYKNQIIGKALSGIVIGILGVTMLLLAALFFIRIPLYLLFMILVISIIGVIFTSFMGMLIDLNYPKLLWDNEQKAVKQNMNAVINIVIACAISAVIVFFMIKINIGLWPAFLLITTVFGIIDVVLYYIITTIGANVYSRIE